MSSSTLHFYSVYWPLPITLLQCLLTYLNVLSPLHFYSVYWHLNVLFPITLSQCLLISKCPLPITLLQCLLTSKCPFPVKVADSPFRVESLYRHLLRLPVIWSTVLALLASTEHGTLTFPSNKSPSLLWHFAVLGWWSAPCNKCNMSHNVKPC